MSTHKPASAPRASTARPPVTQETQDACLLCLVLFLGTIAVLLADVVLR